MIKVLVVDDSLFMRTLVSDMLNSDPEIEVIATAKGGAEALKKIPEIKPDVITLDLSMPGWDGLTTLKHIMSQYSTPVVILSAHTREYADITIECLNAGAIGFVLKPSGELSLDIENVKGQLINEVKAAAKVKVERIKSYITTKSEKERRLSGVNKIIVVGASTGGPQTLETILPIIPSDFAAPILVVQHMPNIYFSQGMATYLNKICKLTVKMAENGDYIQTGNIYIAPGGYHMILEKQIGHPDNFNSNLQHQVFNFNDVVIRLNQGASSDLSPSIDMTMQSAAQLYNENVVGIILSGMGSDGVEGMKAIKEAGGKTIVQDESSLIFGMPKAVIDKGYADKIMPAPDMVDVLMEMVGEKNGKTTW